MPLPTDSSTPWPPIMWRGVLDDIAEADAWYSGDPDKLIDFYGNPTRQVRRSRLADRQRWWATKGTNAQDNPQLERLHMPAASDIAATGADLLFGDPAAFTIAEAHGENQNTEAEATEARLIELIEDDGIDATLLEGAEVCAGLSGVYLRPAWDTDIADHPMLTVVHADRAIPEFRWGQMVAVTLWQQVLTDGAGQVWRHLERYERGTIQHGLYVGSTKELGRPIALDSHPLTAGIAADANGYVDVPNGLRDKLIVSYVPNVKPNRRHRAFPIGRADFAGTEPLMDALDETWSSWMRDIRLGKSRIIVPEQFLERAGRGAGAQFDYDRQVFSPIDVDPELVGKAGITQVEFVLRVEQHARTCSELFGQIVTTSGYSPQSFGLQGDGSNQTATEVDAKEGRSERTTARKQRYWRCAVEDALEVMLIIDAELFASGVVPMRPTMAFPDSAEQDMRATAETLNLLTLAKSVSTETKVKMLNPGWPDSQVQAETARILDEEAGPTMSVGDPTGGAPA